MRKILGAAAAVVAVGAAAAAAVGFGGADGGTAEADVLPPATAPVTRQTLVDTETASGELGYGTVTTVRAGRAGTVTWLANTGGTVARGKPLYRVDDDPVVLLTGSLPAYRDLAPGAAGKDVKQLEKNLRALGYDGFTVDDEYTSATAEAVREWQEDLGLPETGRVERGQVVYAAGPVRVDAHSVAVGDPAQPGAALLTVTGTDRVVTVLLDVDDQRLAVAGAEVRVEVPGGDAVPGTIAEVATVVEQPADPNGEAETMIEVTVTVAEPKALDGLDSAAVDVSFTAAQRPDVLTVPVAALLALAEGGYGVEIIDGAGSRIVAVETGLFAAGRVEVSGDGLAEGVHVGMPS